jgi:hypothetical protein
MKYPGRALYRIERNNKVMPWGRFYSYDHAQTFLIRKFGWRWPVIKHAFLIIDDNDIPF